MQLEMNSDMAIAGAKPQTQMNLFFVLVILMSVRALFEGIAKILIAAFLNLWPSLER